MVALSKLSEMDELPIMEVSRGIEGGKEGTGIGHLVDAATLKLWVNEYLHKLDSPLGIDETLVEAAFQHGVQSESNKPGQSFIEAEPTIRSEWSCCRGQLPWEEVRDAVWAGFDRARDRNM